MRFVNDDAIGSNLSSFDFERFYGVSKSDYLMVIVRDDPITS
jgi:hypothetical protein